MKNDNIKFSIFQIPYLSFYSKELYRDAALNRKGYLFGYLFLLMAVCWFSQVIKFNSALNKFFDTDVPPIVEQIPETKIVNHKLVVEESQPYFIYEPKTSRALAIIDTFGSMKSLGESEAFLLITDSTIMFKQNKIKTETYEINELLKNCADFTLNKTKINNWINIFRKSVIYYIYVFVFFILFLSVILRTLVYAAIGLIFGKLLKFQVPYKTLIRLSVAASSPVLIISTVIGITNIHIPFEFPLSFLCAMFYLFFGIKAAAQNSSLTPENQ